MLYLAPEQIENLISHQDQEFRDFLIVTLRTGCRPQEIRVLEAKYVLLKEGEARMPKELAKGKRKERRVPLDNVVEAGAGIGEPPGCRFINAEKCRYEAADPAAAQLSVAVRQQARGRGDPGGMYVEHGLHDRHDQRGGQSVSFDVADEDAPATRGRGGIGSAVLALVEREEVVEVAAGPAQWLVTRRDLQSGDSWQRCREQRPLEFAHLPGVTVNLLVGGASSPARIWFSSSAPTIAARSMVSSTSDTANCLGGFFSPIAHVMADGRR